MVRIAAAVCTVVTVAACGGRDAAPDDPFQWLEELDSPRVRAWVAAENEKTLGVLEKDPRYAENLATAKELGNAPDRLPMPRLVDGRIVNFWQDPEHTRGIWRVTSVADYESPQPRWATLLDLDALSAAEGKNWVWKGADCESVTGKRCLISLSEGGEDAITIREFDVTTGQFVPDGFVLPRGKQNVAWSGEDTLLVSREWQPGEMTTSGYPYIVKKVTRGRPLADAVEIVRGDKADGLATTPLLLSDGNGRRVNVVQRTPSFFERSYTLLTGSGTAALALPPKSDLAGLVGDRIVLTVRQDWTTEGATFRAGTLVSLKADEVMRDPRRLHATPVYVPGPTETAEGVLATRDRLVVTSLNDVRGRAAVYTPQPDGSWSAAPIPLPDNAAVAAVDADAKGRTAYLSVTSFLEPTAVWRLDTVTGQAQPVKSTPPRFDSSRYVVDQHKAVSPDGTQVPYFIVHSAGQRLDGSTPTIMYGYGGFELSQTPTYDGVLGRLWLERGGAFVVANIRGGGEFGPAWHEAALTTHRQRAFDDFAAVGEDLIARNITAPAHLGILGGSNGGLLMGVELTQHPQMWQAVGIQVPLLDMVRYEQIAAGASWVGEYGSVADPEQRAFLESISPYGQLRAGVRYPEPFIWTTTKDDRVGPQHARKFAARLGELGNPYLFYEATQGGHGAGTTIDEQARMIALQYTYFMRRLMPTT
ncbi:prolyl oligopeptidase family serine peptidase [Nocardia brasiliensis]|uniref:Prolyl oligopeptidase family serine peptidase n=2 Tax=Nocardia brasiliensis TaxID=37326 RepID=A0A6G9Y3S4_NOCBR|nr:prolyl oligopeptidase family serine peptidase [Nocardia brasiliensis]